MVDLEVFSRLPDAQEHSIPPRDGFMLFHVTPPKTDMDSQNDGLEKVVPFKYGHSWYLC